jgi:predicted DNA-binding WGR domain protein
MRRFELSDGSSNKFWEMDYVGGSSSFTVRWGRIGTNGQTQIKEFASSAKAETEQAKLVKEKLDKGYSETGEGSSVVQPPQPSPPPAVASVAHVSQTSVPAAPAAPVPAVPIPAASAAAIPSAPPSAAPVEPVTTSENDVRWPTALAKMTLPSRYRTGWIAAHPVLNEAQLVAHFAADDSQWRKERRDAVAAYVAGPATNDKAIRRAIEASQGDAVELVGLRAGWEVAFNAVVECVMRTSNFYWSGWTDALRQRFAIAPEDEYSAACAVARQLAQQLSKQSSNGDGLAALLAYIFPDEPWSIAIADTVGPTNTDLLADCSAVPGPGVTAEYGLWIQWNRPTSVCVSLYQRFGDAALPWLLSLPANSADDIKVRSRLLAAIGSDTTFGELVANMADRNVQPHLMDAANAQPRRAVRLLSAVRGRNADLARSSLAKILEKHPGIGETVAELGAEQRNVIESLTKRVDVAPDEQVPAALLVAPWSAKRSTVRPVVQNVLVQAPPPVLEWTKVERNAAATIHLWVHSQTSVAGVLSKGVASPIAIMSVPDAAGKSLVGKFAGKIVGKLSGTDHDPAAQLLELPPEHEGYYNEAALLRVLDRFGEDAISYVCRVIAQWPRDHFPNFPYLGAVELSLTAAKGLWSKSLRESASAWTLRFPRHVVAGLIPVALGKLSKDRDAAEKTLRFLNANGHGALIAEVATTGGAEVAVAVDAILNMDPFALHPVKMPATPAWVSASAVSPPLLRDGLGALPVAAVANVMAMMSFSDLDHPYAGLELLREVCTADSIAKFAWDVFNQWLGSGAPSQSSWALSMQGLLGNDATARNLSSYIFTWPGEGGHTKAVAGLDVLARIGSDVSLMHLNRIAERAQFAALKKNARERIDAIAADRGLTPEELADRLVPDLGLDENGTLWFDFGPRRFQVGFDELLSPFVKDESGAKLRALPKPNSKDDPALASGAGEQWKALKKDATAAAKVQMRRIELGMTLRRRWTAEQFGEFFVHHPLMGHVARRLVWATYDADGSMGTTFRVAEDRTFADHHDDEFALSEDAIVGIPHVLELSQDLVGAWGTVMSDYELLQPFNQLGRETFPMSAADRESVKLDCVAGTRVHFGKIIALETKGWSKGDVLDGGVIGEMIKPVAKDVWASLHLPEGLYMGMMSETPEQTLEGVELWNVHSRYQKTESLKFGILDPIVFSELIRDLESLKS